MQTTPSSININEIIALVTSVGALISSLVIAIISWRKWKPEVKKLEGEEQSEIGEAAESVASGAKSVVEGLQVRVTQLEAQLKAEQESRKRDTEYLRRRIRDAEQESRDYRNWAAQLARQVIQAGGQPVPFLPTEDTETGLSAASKPDPKKE